MQHLSASLVAHFADYEQHHKNWVNKVLHFIAIPAIVFTTLGLLARVNLFTEYPWIDLGLVLWFLATLWYVFLDLRLGIVFSVVTLLLWVWAQYAPLSVHVAVFIAAWIVQLIGHAVFEKNRPAFLKNLRHLLVGPLWIFYKLFAWVSR